MTTEKFNHLNGNKPNVRDILRVRVELVDEKQLWTLWNHFKSIQDEYRDTDPKISSAASLICKKIDLIMNLWRSGLSWEVMRAANDANYYALKDAANDDSFLQEAA